MESCVSRLDICVAENRFADMPYLLGILAGWNEALLEIAKRKLRESKEVTNVVEVQVMEETER